MSKEISPLMKAVSKRSLATSESSANSKREQRTKTGANLFGSENEKSKAKPSPVQSTMSKQSVTAASVSSKKSPITGGTSNPNPSEERSQQATETVLNPFGNSTQSEESPSANPFDEVAHGKSSRGSNPFGDSKGECGPVLTPSPSKKSTLFAHKDVEIIEKGEKQTAGDRKAESRNMYHAVHFGTAWMLIAIALHLLQFGFLIGIGSSALHPAALTMLVLAVIAVPMLLLIARLQCRPAHAKSLWSSDALTVDQETDIIPDSAVYLLCVAALLEGLACAVYPTASASTQANRDANDDDSLSGVGFNSFQTMGQILSFASVTFYAIHRILRPANRLDPLRTILELEAVSMCWDALDGASLYQLLIQSNPTGQDSTDQISRGAYNSAQFLMTFWYLSIGIRVAVMFGAHLSEESPLYKYLFSPPLTLSASPTVDRTLSAIRLKSLSTILMATAQFFAAGLRISLWSAGDLSSLQQEMMIKNILFLMTVAGAMMWKWSTENRDWNTRDIFALDISSWNIHIDIKKPIRTTQLEILRYCFVVSYIVVGALMSALLAQAASGGALWCLNIVTDVALCALFLHLCKSVHNTRAWVIFPREMATILGIALLINLYAARVPIMYWYAGDMDSDGHIWSYTNALLVLLASLVPIASYVMFWSICNMLYHAEFTACPGHYNAIHDPGNTLVISATMLEGALDIVSATSLLALAETSGLPSSVDGAIIFFAFLELCNSCQSFMLLVQMSAGINDTPSHLVKWRSGMRMFGGVLDLGVLLLRLSLWIKYNVADNVFLVKNINSLIQTIALVERAQGTEKYCPNELFFNFVLPRDWYGVESEEEWTKLIAVPPDYK